MSDVEFCEVMISTRALIRAWFHLQPVNSGVARFLWESRGILPDVSTCQGKVWTWQYLLSVSPSQPRIGT